MKKVCLFVTAVFLMLLASCGDGEKTTTKSFGTISPVTEKINGPLGQYYEVVIKDYKPSDRNKVSVELKRVQEGFPEPWNAKMKVGYGDGCFEPLFTAEFQDEDGNVLSKDKTDIVIERDELEALAVLLVGETCTIGFDVRDEKTRKVKLTSTFEVHEAESFAESTYEKETGDEDDQFADTEIDIDNADSGDF